MVQPGQVQVQCPGAACTGQDVCSSGPETRAAPSPEHSSYGYFSVGCRHGPGHLGVVGDVRVDVDGDLLGRHQPRVHGRGLALHLAGVLHDVYPDGELQAGDDAARGGQRHVTRVAEELARLVADVARLPRLDRNSVESRQGSHVLTCSVSSSAASLMSMLAKGCSVSSTSLLLVQAG